MTSTLGGIVRIATDISLIAMFDPTLLKERVKEPKRWCADPFATPEWRDGRIALWPLGGRGGLYRVRLGTELLEAERPFHRGATAPAGLVTQGEVAFLGPGERLPGDGFGDRYSAIPDKGGLLPLPPGRWSVTAHVLDWRPEPRFWNEENEPTADAPPDFVLVAAPAESLPPAPALPLQPLLDLLPQKKAKGGERVVQPNARPRGPVVLEDEKPGKRRGGDGPRPPREPSAPRAHGVIKIAPGKPGELREGARVRHPSYGNGTVVFVRDGFPKARVTFDGQDEEIKVDKHELVVLS